jgi:hypothetical protein
LIFSIYFGKIFFIYNSLPLLYQGRIFFLVLRVYMETLIIKFSPELQPHFLEYDFIDIKNQITKIMEKRVCIENLINKGQSHLIETAMVKILQGNEKLNSEDSGMSNSDLKKIISTLKIAMTTEIKFQTQSPFILMEESYLLWCIKVDYKTMAIQQTEELMENLNNKLSGNSF